MPSLIQTGYGNRWVDAFGNTHVRLHPRGGTVVRNPGGYRGRHRRPQPPNLLLRLALRWEGFDV